MRLQDSYSFFNVVSNVEISVNKFFGFSFILKVLNVYLYNYYVQFNQSMSLLLTGLTLVSGNLLRK